MKKTIKLTETTLTRIVERVIKDLVAELIKKLGLPVTPKGKQELKI